MVSATLSPLEAELESCTGAWLIKQSRDFLSVADVCIFGWIGFDIGSEIQKLVDLLNGKIQWIQQMSHLILLLYSY